MDFLSVLKVLRRRWYVAVSALLVSVVLALLTFMSITTVYESSGVAVLTSPSAGAKFTAGTPPEDVVKINPLLAFDGSLTTSAQIIRQILVDPATENELGAGKGATVTYTVTNGDATTSGPFLFIVADSDSASVSQDMVGRVLDRVRTELRTRQQAVDAPPSTFIQAEFLVNPTEAEEKINGKVRYAGAVFVLALIALLASTFAVDNVLNLRAQRKDPNDDLLDDDLAADAMGVNVPDRQNYGKGVPAAEVPSPAPVPTPMPAPALMSAPGPTPHSKPVPSPRPSPMPRSGRRPTPVLRRVDESGSSVDRLHHNIVSETMRIPARQSSQDGGREANGHAVLRSGPSEGARSAEQ